MKKEVVIPYGLALLGLIFLGLGINAYLTRGREVYACDACGMEITKDDISTHKLTLEDGSEHYACCPVCALAMGIYYQDTTVSSRCYSCGKDITMNINDGNITTITMSREDYNLSMIFAKACLRNKLVCSEECLDVLGRSEPWTLEHDIISIGQVYSIASKKVTQFTIEVNPVKTPTTIYTVIGVGILLVISAPIASSRMKQR